MYLDEYFGNFLFGVHNPYKCEEMTRDEMEPAILQRVINVHIKSII